MFWRRAHVLERRHVPLMDFIHQLEIAVNDVTLLEQYGLAVSRRQDYLASLERLKRIHVDVFIGAHPDQNDTFAKRDALKSGRNAFIDPSAWPSFLQLCETNASAAFASSR